jgi:predicted ABC-type ATPase
VGPNGSGKSTLYDYLVNIRAFNEYCRINPDIIAKELPIALNLSNWKIDFSQDELCDFLKKTTFQSLTQKPLFQMISVSNKVIWLADPNEKDIVYLSASIAEFLRKKMIAESNSSFAYESVFSHDSKIDEIKYAKQNGYKIYLYFIATNDYRLNTERVRQRVERGGHNVPEQKIKDRWFRTMDNIFNAFVLSDRVFFFDNSANFEFYTPFSYFAEKKNDILYISTQTDKIPQWFYENILKKMQIKQEIRSKNV